MDLDGSIFWYFGGALVLAALVISFIGIRGKDSFPPTGRAMGAGIAVFGFLVVGAAAYGVANASEEKEHRDAEIAAEEAEAEEAVAEEPPPEGAAAPSTAGGGEPTGEAPPAPAGQDLAITSPDDGSLVYDPDGLSASAGPITLAYENPSVVTHNVALEDDAGQLLIESEDVFEASVEISADVVPGEYIYFCTVPGHREGGMEGTLTVE